MSNLVKFSSQLDEKLLESLRALAASSGRTLASVLNEAATEYLERAAVRPAFRKSLEEVLDEHHEVLARLAK